MMEYSTILDKARRDHKINKRYVEQVIRKKPNDLDKIFQDQHDKAFEKINCVKCANCCKTTSPIFYEKDIERAAKFLKIKPGIFTEKYLTVDEDKDHVLKSAPCAFLSDDNLCSIYDARPTACKEYPHTNRKKVVQLMELTLKNSLICPAVAEIFNQLAPTVNPQNRK